MKINNFIIFLFSFFVLNSCAKPTVVDIVLPNDQNLNCKQLKNEYLETRRFKEEAVAVQNAPGGNTARAVLFWPALLKTLHNADIAVKAANKRAYHIIDIMKKKNCKDSETLFNQLTKSSNRIISDEIRNLHKLYEKGALTKEEFERAKAKVLE
tara:strand:- start:312 stop:773 length:462 start_codon:yes stop_codon:yes gene_type:complete